MNSGLWGLIIFPVCSSNSGAAVPAARAWHPPRIWREKFGKTKEDANLTSWKDPPFSWWAHISNSCYVLSCCCRCCAPFSWFGKGVYFQRLRNPIESMHFYSNSRGVALQDTGISGSAIIWSHFLLTALTSVNVTFFRMLLSRTSIKFSGAKTEKTAFWRFITTCCMGFHKFVCHFSKWKDWNPCITCITPQNSPKSCLAPSKTF